MKKQGFLGKRKKAHKLELVEPSEEICKSYLWKADNSLKSAKILLQNSLYEDSISSSYYAMYNSLTALLFKIGVKCENHAASILLLRSLFSEEELFRIISFAKEERIDNQYYITSEKNLALGKESAEDMAEKAESFLVKTKLFIQEIRNEHMVNFRGKFAGLNGS